MAIDQQNGPQNKRIKDCISASSLISWLILGKLFTFLSIKTSVFKSIKWIYNNNCFQVFLLFIDVFLIGLQ